MKKFAIVAFVFGMVGIAAAADPNGTWTWKSKGGKGGKEVENTLKLEFKDGKLTGTVSGGFGGKGGMDNKIEDGKFKNDEISFTVTREFKDMKFVTKYSGKLSDDKIKGTIIRGAGGDKETKTDWEATRAKKKD